MKKISIILCCLLFISCSSSPELDLSDTKLYLFPSRAFVPAGEDNFTFTSKHKAKAKKAARKLKYDILYEVYLNKDGTVKSAKLVKKTKFADSETVAKIRHQISTKGYFNSFGKNSAFFYGVTVRAEIEYL